MRTLWLSDFNLSETHASVAQIPALVGKGWYVIVPDLRGFGASSRPKMEADYTLHSVQADVLANLDVLGVRECGPALGFV